MVSILPLRSFNLDSSIYYDGCLVILLGKGLFGIMIAVII
jgi:hypothetical protein